MTKKIIKAEVGTLSVEYEFAENIIANLQEYVNKYGSKNVSILERSYEYSNDFYYAIMVNREETDDEEQKREALEARAKLEQDARDRIKFEELKKKFE